MVVYEGRIIRKILDFLKLIKMDNPTMEIMIDELVLRLNEQQAIINRLKEKNGALNNPPK